MTLHDYCVQRPGTMLPRIPDTTRLGHTIRGWLPPWPIPSRLLDDVQRQVPIATTPNTSLLQEQQHRSPAVHRCRVCPGSQSPTLRSTESELSFAPPPNWTRTTPSLRLEPCSRKKHRRALSKGKSQHVPLFSWGRSSCRQHRSNPPRNTRAMQWPLIFAVPVF